MIYGFVGDLGCGKTICMTHLGWMLQKSGVDIYSNYHLEFPHHRIENIAEISQITTPKNALLFDEIWITADSRKSSQYESIMLSTNLLQSRKKHADVFYTTQYINQVDVRIRSITNFIFAPQIIITDAKGIPMIARMEVLKRNIYGDMLKDKTIHIVIYGTHNLYNTDELISQTKSNRYKDITEKYKDFIGKKGTLVSKLIIDNNMTKTDARMIADYIMAK